MCPAFLFMTDNFQKPFKTIDEQIEILKNRNLIIDNEDVAKKTLQSLSYYKIVNGYQNPFWAKTDYFLNGTSFFDVILFYKFDTIMRNDMLNCFLTLETKIKTIISYEYCKEYGALGYLDKNNYAIKANATKLDKFMETMEQIKADSIKDLSNDFQSEHAQPKYFKYIPVRHYIQKYHNVPLWVMMESLTLGNVSVFYELMPKKIRVNVAKSISELSQVQYNERDITTILSSMTILRNTCAHGNTIYNFKIKKNLTDNSFVKIIKNDYPNLNTNNLSLGFIILASILPNTEVKMMFELVLKLYNACVQNYPPRVIEKIKHAMGFDLCKLIKVLKNHMPQTMPY